MTSTSIEASYVLIGSKSTRRLAEAEELLATATEMFNEACEALDNVIILARGRWTNDT